MNNNEYLKAYAKWQLEVQEWSKNRPETPERPEFRTDDRNLVAFLDENGRIQFSNMNRNTLDLPPEEMLRFSKWLHDLFYFG